MKNKSVVAVLLAVMLAITTLLTSCKKNNTDQTTLHISPVLCTAMFEGVSPNEFCNSKGENTFLENKYLQAQVGKDGCLILTLKDEVISEWKNTITALQVLQCVLGDSRNIGITTDYSKDFLDYMKDAHTCGYEISEDFTKVIESPEDSSWYFPFTTLACAIMQVFEGKTCTEIKVEHVEVDETGEVIETFIFPDDADIPLNYVK